MNCLATIIQSLRDAVSPCRPFAVSPTRLLELLQLLELLELLELPSILLDPGGDGFGQIFAGAGRYDAGCFGRVG